MSVDTYLKGKNLEPYQRFGEPGGEVFVADKLFARTNKIEILTRKGFLGTKLLALAYLPGKESCVIER